MTLVELLIVIAIIGMLAAITYPMFGSASDTAKVSALASNVKHIQSMIIQKASTNAVPLSPGGYPLTVDPAWFRANRMPLHPFCGRAIVVEEVTEADDVIYPADKTFDPALVGDASAWYNATNGVFRARVPALATDAQTLALFNDANLTAATGIAQTTD
jgi:prepilin-type N-terminal cleavage/methylation domain-containing protein